MLGNLPDNYKDTEAEAFKKANAGESGSSTPSNETTNSSGNKEKKTVASLRYPSTKLDKSDDYLKIEIFDFTPPGLDFASRPDGKQLLRLRTSDEAQKTGLNDLKGTIILPIPEGIVDSNAASWEAGGLNPIAQGIVAASNAFLSGAEKNANVIESAGAMLGTVSGMVKTVLETSGPSAQKIVSGYTAGLVANALAGSNVGAVVGRSNGIALNPNQQLLFNSTVGRTFQFGWDIVPRNKKESDEVKQIIRTLKINMAATRDATETVSGVFLKSPRVFKLQYMHGASAHPFLNRFKIMALTGMAVNYTGSNTYATYDDGTPVHMQLTLGFSELTAIYSGDYKGVGGVGY